MGIKGSWNLDQTMEEEGKVPLSWEPSWKKKDTSWGKPWEKGKPAWQSPRFPRRRNWGKGWQGKPWWGWGFWQKSAVAVFLLMLLYGLFQLDSPWAKTVQDEVRQAATMDTDYAPLLNAVTRLGQWTDILKVTSATVPVTGPDLKAGKTLVMPVNGQVIQAFGWIKSPMDGQKRFSEGVCLRAPQGTPVVAPTEATVVKVAEDPVFGLTLQLDHGQGLTTLLGHLDRVTVQAGQKVKEGETVGRIGKTGAVSEPQLYMEVRQKGELVDPLSLMVVIQGSG